MNFLLKITPKIAPKVRHQLEDVLKNNGFEVVGGGQTVDVPLNASFSDISFEDKE